SSIEFLKFADGYFKIAETAASEPIFENFENGNLNGWTGAVIVSNEDNFSSFLTSDKSYSSPTTTASDLGLVGTQDVYKTFDLSGSQTSVTITFTFNRIDSWDNENFLVW